MSALSYMTSAVNNKTLSLGDATSELFLVMKATVNYIRNILDMIRTWRDSSFVGIQNLVIVGNYAKVSLPD